MEKLKLLIEQYHRWKPLDDYVNRIVAHVDADFSLAIENSKALLESISKEICELKGMEIKPNEKFQSILRIAFQALGYSNNDMVNQVGRSLTTIAQQMGNLRNEIGAIAHGRPLQELQERNNKISNLTKEFIIDSTELLACFLIRNIEQDSPALAIPDEEPEYEKCDDFNQEWDDIYGEFSMGDYAYPASEILYNVDKKAYISEYKMYQRERPEL